jgi:riboflavin synthase
MFTGIITQLGTCTERSANGLKLDCSEELAGSLAIGSSIAVNGVCLTVTSLGKSGFGADVMSETWQRTALGKLKLGSTVNLELPLGVGGRFDGHIVQGHIDGTGKIVSIKPDGKSHIFTIATAKDLTRYMIDKGSVTLNGISLTIISVSPDRFNVGIIPHTYMHTMLQQAAVGDPLNIEVDIMAKYFMKFIKEQNYERS